MKLDINSEDVKDVSYSAMSYKTVFQNHINKYFNIYILYIYRSKLVGLDFHKKQESKTPNSLIVSSPIYIAFITQNIINWVLKIKSGNEQ